ncbi:hypothetical protein [Cohnella algarum]|nr:hypothetical protein [Cohnella algarum]
MDHELLKKETEENVSWLSFRISSGANIVSVELKSGEVYNFYLQA